MKRAMITVAASALLAISPFADAMGMGGGMGGGMMGGGYSGGMGNYGDAGPLPGQGPGARSGNADRDGEDRGYDASHRDAAGASRDPYTALNLSAAQRQQIAHIRQETAREERRRIDAVLSPQQRERLGREGDRR